MTRLLRVTLLGVLMLGIAAPAFADHRCDRFCRHPPPRRSSSGGNLLLGIGLGVLLDRVVLRPQRRERVVVQERVYVPPPPPQRAVVRERVYVPPPAERPVARADDLRVERLRGGRLEIAWLGDERGIDVVELVTTDRNRRVLSSARLRGHPFAATLETPPVDGFVGVTLHARDGSATSVYLPAEAIR